MSHDRCLDHDCPKHSYSDPACRHTICTVYVEPPVKIASMIPITPAVLEDSKFDWHDYAAKRLSIELTRYAVQEELVIRLGSLKIETYDGGFYRPGDRNWWQRLLRRDVPDVWVPILHVRGTALADPR
jgi:hypothetical protein